MRPDVVHALVACRRAVGIELTDDDHCLVLAAWALAGCGREAEAYVRDRAAGGSPVGPTEFELVLRAYAIRGTVDDLERVYLAAEAAVVGELPAETRLAFLEGLAAAGAPQAVSEWCLAFEARGLCISAPMYAALVDAYGHAGRREHLRILRMLTPVELCGEPQVADAFVHAFAAVGDAEAAEASLETALRVVPDPDCRQALVHVCVMAHLRGGEREAAKRVGATGARYGVDLEGRP